jgi:hypothetical protein
VLHGALTHGCPIPQMQPGPLHVRKRVTVVPGVARYYSFIRLLQTQLLTGTRAKRGTFPPFLIAIDRRRSVILGRRSCYLFCAAPHIRGI